MYKALSLFSGCGGMDIGVENAGFEIIADIEIDPYCCETLRHNKKLRNKNTVVIEGDIRLINPIEIQNQLRSSSENIDLLFGGPPCQAFSQIGKMKALDDERGLLLFEIIKFARIFKPKAIFIEQVKGLLSAKDERGMRGGVFNQFLNELDKSGYVSKWQIINAAQYGIPQERKRLFVVATPKKNGFHFPEPTHGPIDKQQKLFPLLPYVSVGQVISDLPNPILKSLTYPTDSHMDVTPERDRERIHNVPEGQYLASQLQLSKKIRCNLGKKDTTKYLRLHRQRPSKTLRCGEIFFHPLYDRYLTPREYMRLHGYPDTYELKGPIRSRCGVARNLDQHRQIANSVPPLLAEVIAKKIKEVI